MANRPKGSGGLLAAVALGAAVVGVVWHALSRSKGARKPMRTPRSDTAADARSPGLLRESILGTSKQMVQSVFGPPRAAGGVAVVPGAGSHAYWEADTWYYALDPRRKTVMAIRFVDGVARDVDFVDGAPDRGE